MLKAPFSCVSTILLGVSLELLLTNGGRMSEKSNVTLLPLPVLIGVMSMRNRTAFSRTLPLTSIHRQASTRLVGGMKADAIHL